MNQRMAAVLILLASLLFVPHVTFAQDPHPRRRDTGSTTTHKVELICTDALRPGELSRLAAALLDKDENVIDLGSADCVAIVGGEVRDLAEIRRVVQEIESRQQTRRPPRPPRTRPTRK